MEAGFTWKGQGQEGWRLELCCWSWERFGEAEEEWHGQDPEPPARGAEGKHGHR